MRIALVNPQPFQPFYSTLKNVSLPLKETLLYPPLSLCYLAGSLKEKGYKVKIIDWQTEKINFKKLMKFDVIGIHLSFYSLLSAFEIAEKVKEIKSETKIVVGGIPLFFYPHQIFSKGKFDYGILGEGEIALPLLLEKIEENRNLKGLKGIVFREKGKIRINNGLNLIKNLDELSFPDFETLKLKKYVHWFFGKPFLPILTSRGCPFKCGFCSKYGWNEVYRWHSPEYILNEIEFLLEKYKIDSFAIVDDIFTLNKARIKKLNRLFKENNVKIEFEANSRVDTIDYGTLKLLKQMGLKNIFFGVESGDPLMLKRMNKLIDLKKLLKIIQKCKKLNIYVSCCFILGYLNETPRSLKNTLKLIKKINVPNPLIHYFIPFPGSKAYIELLNKFGLEDLWKRMIEVEELPKFYNEEWCEVTKKQLQLVKGYLEKLKLLGFITNNQNLKHFYLLKRIRSIINYYEQRI